MLFTHLPFFPTPFIFSAYAVKVWVRFFLHVSVLAQGLAIITSDDPVQLQALTACGALFLHINYQTLAYVSPHRSRY